MKKTLLTITLAILASYGMQAQTTEETGTRSIEIGPYTHPAGDEGEDGLSVWEKAPVNFHYIHSGSQIIYTADKLADIAGDNGEITDLSFVFADMSMDWGTMDMTLYVENFDEDEFQEIFPGTGRYVWYTYDSSTSKAQLSYEFEHYYYEDIVLDFHLDTPLKYEGQNLLVTVKAQRSPIDDISNQWAMPFVERTKGLCTMVHAHDSNSFDKQYDTGEAESSNYVEKWVPAVKISYQPAADGIGSVSITTDAPVRYYNLQGIEMQGDLAPGVYIERRGDKTTKVAIR